MSLRVLVCGGRMYANRNRIFEVLSALHRERGIEVILHGAASGADLLSVAWADRNGLPAIGFPANWAKDGKLAVQRRNQKIISEGHPHLLVAFPGGKGTAEMIRFAKSERLDIIEVAESIQRVGAKARQMLPSDRSVCPNLASTAR